MNLLDFFIENEKLRSEWAEDLNTEDPSKLLRSSNKKVWWRCEKGHSWQTQVISRTMNGSGCPYCSGRKAIPGETDLATKYPDIARQWDYEKNGGIDPQNVTAGSTKKAWWRCEKGHSWQVTVNNRTKSGSDCPYCVGKRAIPGETDLVTKHPDIASQWDYEKNGDLDPQNVTAGSHKKVWWRCEKGHSWQTMVYSRAAGGNGCPYCSGYNAIPGKTDLATLRPDIACQWDYEKNPDIVPQNVAARSRKKVWWRCEKGHSWQVEVYIRTHNGRDCPVCSEKGRGAKKLHKDSP